MRAGITWYDILGAPPDASSEDIQQAYDAKAGVLRPELLSGAPTAVVTAAARAQGIIDAARQGQAIDTSTSHMGFRCILRGTSSGPG